MGDNEVISMIVKSLDRMENKLDAMHGKFMNLPCQTHSLKIETLWREFEAKEKKHEGSINSKVFKIAFMALSIAGAAIAMLKI